MLNFSFWDIVLISMLGLIIFGPNKLPEIARTVGKGFFEFRQMTGKVSDAIKEESAEIKKEISITEKNDDNSSKENNKHETQG